MALGTGWKDTVLLKARWSSIDSSLQGVVQFIQNLPIISSKAVPFFKDYIFRNWKYWTSQSHITKSWGIALDDWWQHNFRVPYFKILAKIWHYFQHVVPDFIQMKKTWSVCFMCTASFIVYQNYFEDPYGGGGFATKNLHNSTISSLTHFSNMNLHSFLQVERQSWSRITKKCLQVDQIKSIMLKRTSNYKRISAYQVWELLGNTCTYTKLGRGGSSAGLWCG